MSYPSGLRRMRDKMGVISRTSGAGKGMTVNSPREVLNRPGLDCNVLPRDGELAGNSVSGPRPPALCAGA